MAIIREDQEKTKALQRVNDTLELVKKYRDCINILQSEADISITVKPAGGKRGVRVDSGMESEASRLSGIMVGIVKRMARTVNRDAAKYDIALSDEENALLSFEEADTTQPSSQPVLQEDEHPAELVSDPPEQIGANEDAQLDVQGGDVWSDFAEPEDNEPERQGRRFFGL